MIDLSTATATDALDALARGAITSEALLTAQLERVERFNPVLNAVVAMDLDGALRDARAADEARRQGRLTGPLHGLPMTIKDIFATRGLVTTSGHAPLSDYRPEADAPAVAALRAAGAVVFGKTNLPEFGGDIQSYNDIFGLCRNPWNPERTGRCPGVWHDASGAGQRHRRVHTRALPLQRGFRPQADLERCRPLR